MRTIKAAYAIRHPHNKTSVTIMVLMNRKVTICLTAGGFQYEIPIERHRAAEMLQENLEFIRKVV